MAHREQDLHEPAQPLTNTASLSWPLSILNALITGIAGMVAAGFVANACVTWYHISSFEGASGYFVVLIALLGLVAGCVIGVITARLVAAKANPGFLKALGRSLGVVAGLTLLGGGTARVLADVPPTIDGEELLLVVEVRWPQDQVERPTGGPDGASLTLHSLPWYSRTVRASDRGPLWMQDAHLMDGRWVVPGAVSVFTERGRRMLEVSTNDDDPQASEGFVVPLPARPGRRDMEWSEWLPRLPVGTQPFNKLSYRFRVQRTSEIARTDVIGDWKIGTKATGFYRQQVNGRTVTATAATFTMRHQDQPAGFTDDSASMIGTVALLARPVPAFLVYVDHGDRTGRNYLLSADSGRVRTDDIDESFWGMRGEQLTADTARFRTIRRREVTRGQVDRVTYDQPGLYLLGHVVIDTRTLQLHRFTPDSSASGIPSVPPLSLSPDERSFVQFANAGYPSEAHVLVVTNFVDDTTYVLPVDETRMRYPDFEALDPSWIAHHFEWKRGAGGFDLLVQRSQFTPFPYLGTVSIGTNGDRSYRIEKGSESLRTALVAFLVANFRAKPQEVDSGAYQYPVTIDGKVVNVAQSGDFGYVLVSLEDPGTDTTLVPEIARQFNAALATGRYDSMFAQ